MPGSVPDGTGGSSSGGLMGATRFERVTTAETSVPTDTRLSGTRLVDELIAQVRQRTPVDAREEVSVARFLVEMERLTEPMNEQADPVHVTASGIVVGPRGVLLLKHRRLGIWVQPGGHVDAGETPWEAARREVWEETGLSVTLREGREIGPLGLVEVVPIAHVDVHPGPRGHTHLDLRYLMDAGAEDPCPGPEESQQVEWLDWPEAIARADEGLRGALIALRP